MSIVDLHQPCEDADFTPVEWEEEFLMAEAAEETSLDWLRGALDDLSGDKYRHRRQLNLPELYYNVAWLKGFDGEKTNYKKGSRMWRAFEAGKRAKQKVS